MARRRPPEPPAGVPEVPERLRRFEPEEWIDLWEYLPDWWELDKDGSVAWFRYLHARKRYEAAVRAWEDEHGVEAT